MNIRNYEELRKLTEDHLLDFFPEIDSKSETINDSMAYSVTAGGKRLRPVLLLAACKFCGGDVMGALPYACAVEYIHTASLIHDDLPAMDDDDLRRGKPTNHKVFGEAMAVLAGDGLLISSFEAMSKDMLLYLDRPDQLKRRVKAIYEIAKGVGCRGMIAGQVSDVEQEGKTCSKELLDYIHLNKTAALLIAAVRAGACLGEPNAQKMDDLTDYAECLGLAFQIADDLLDVCGDEEELGKPIGSDEAQGKSTYPCIYGMEAARERLQELTDRARGYMVDYLEEGQFFVDLAEMLCSRKK